MKTICHCRQTFYDSMPSIYWYEFFNDNDTPLNKILIPHRFLNVPTSKYYEYGGTHEEAISDLRRLGFIIIEGKEF